jgi:CrcB protein
VNAIGVMLGGGLGALARYLVEGVVAGRQRSPFPLGTLIVNVSGSAALGAVVGAVGHGWLPASAGLWIGTGFIGAFTTFSTFTYETLRLVGAGAWRSASWNVALSGSLSVGAASLTYLATK